MPDLTPVKMDINIIYDCADYAVIDKPAGITVHPAPGHAEDTIVNAMLAEFDISDENDLRPGIVHRLDKDTSALCLLPRTEMHVRSSQRSLRREKSTKDIWQSAGEIRKKRSFFY